MELNSARTIVVPATLTAASVERLSAELAGTERDGAAALVLRGSREGFCAGLDLDQLTGDGPVAAAAVAAFADCLERLRRFPAPVIAIATGPSSGGGVGLVAAADFVIAAASASFALTELLFGLTPAVVAPALLTRLSPARLKTWAITAERWDAGAAHAAGLVDLVVAGADVERAATAWTRRLMRADQVAVGELKGLLADLASGRTVDRAAMTTSRLGDPRVRSRMIAFTRDGAVPWGPPQ